MRASARRRRASVFIVLSLLYLVVLLFPVYWMAMMMLKPSDLMFVRPTEWAFSPTLSHFEYVVKHGFLGNLGTSLIVSIGSTALVVLIGTPAAYAFARFPLWRRDDLFLFILATRMAPPVALAIPFYLIYAKLDILDTHLGLIVVYLTFNLSFYVWVLCSFCRDLPVELEEAALADGYSRGYVLYKVVLPLLRPGIVATSVLCFIFAWNEFLYAFLLGGRSVKTLPVAIPTLITGQGVLWGELAVVGVIAIVPVFIVVFYLQRHIIRGLTMGAVKG